MTENLQKHKFKTMSHYPDLQTKTTEIQIANSSHTQRLPFVSGVSISALNAGGVL